MADNYHHQITDPLEIHEEKNARDAALGTVLRFNGAGQGVAVPAQLGLATATMVGSSITLTAEQAASALLTINGNLVADSTVIVPDSWGPVAVRNEAAGPYTLTVKTATGGGVVVPQLAGAFLAVIGGDVLGFHLRNRYASVTAAGASTTLTDHQAGAEVLTVTGTLTANSDIVVPDWWGPAFVRNETTGAFTLTIKTASGIGLAVGAGKAVSLALAAGDTVALTAEV